VKIIIVTFYLFLSILGNSQNNISVDSLKNYLIADSTLIKLEAENQYLEVKNTTLGIVIYEPSNTLVQLSKAADTIVELDGFEIYTWNVAAIDTLIEDTLKITANCSVAWGEAQAVFKFIKLNTTPELMMFTRTIYDENDVEILHYEKVIIEKIALRDLVCLREPTPYTPGTELPFIKLDLENLSFASIQDLEK
jgi:hypothetical protein